MTIQNDDYQGEAISPGQAKNELVRLRELQEATYIFLHTFCNYDIKQPLQTVMHFPELILLEPLTKQQAHFLAGIKQCGEEIQRIIDAVRDAAGIERERVKIGDFYKPERTDLRPIIAEGISQILNKVEYDNETLAALLEKEKSDNRLIVSQARDPIEVKTNIPDDLPAVWGNSSIVRHIISDVTWFISRHHLKIEIGFNADYDDEWVNVVIGCSAFDTHTYILRDFQQFEVTPTFLALNAESLLLYNSWRMLKTYDGRLSFNIEDNTNTQEPSKTSVIIALRRYSDV